MKFGAEETEWGSGGMEYMVWRDKDGNFGSIKIARLHGQCKFTENSAD
jgi:hypothetical protein